MSYDTDHAAFVRQAYRYVTKIDPAVKSCNPLAREITIDTQSDVATATALADAYLAENEQPRAFEIVLEGAMALDSFVGGPPALIPISDTLHTDGRTCKAFNVVDDFQVNTTTVQVRG